MNASPAIHPPLQPFPLPEANADEIGLLLRRGIDHERIIELATCNLMRFRTVENRARRWIAYTTIGAVPTIAGNVFSFVIEFNPPSCRPVAAGGYLLWKEP